MLTKTSTRFHTHVHVIQEAMITSHSQRHLSSAGFQRDRL